MFKSHVSPEKRTLDHEGEGSDQSWNRSGRTGQDRTKISSGRTKPDFCQIFLTDFLPDFCQFDVKNESTGFQPDRTGQILNPAGPDRMEKTRPVPALLETLGGLQRIYALFTRNRRKENNS